MTEPKKKSSLGKKLLLVLGSLVVLVIVLFFIVTSGAFIKGFILPKVSKSVGADITAGDISLSPFSSVTLKKLKVQAPGQEPLLEADEVVARYNLMDIIGGNINVSEVTINSPTVKLIEDENGNTNLDPLTKSKSATDDDKKTPPSKSEKPPALDVKNVSLKNATVLKIKKLKGGGEERLELSNINLSLDQLKNGGSGKLDLAAAVKMEASTNTLAATLAGKFDFSLTADLLPQNAKGSLQTDIKNATGAYADFKNLGLGLNADLSPTEIKNVALQFTQAGKGLGEILVSGPFDANKVEGKLKLEIASIDKQLLNVFGAAQGIDFGSTKISSLNNIELGKGGKEIAMDGGVALNSFSLTRTNQTTPALDLNLKYSFTFDQAANYALIKTFTIDGQQNQRTLLRGALSKPMKLDFAKADAGVDESAFDLAVTDLNLADWKAFAADLNPSGKVGLKLNVVSQAAGKKIKYDVTADLAGFGAKLGTNQIEKVDLHLSTVGQVSDLAKVNLEKLGVEVSHNSQPAATVSASGQYVIESGDADLKTTLEATLPTIFRFLASPDISASSGKLTFTGQVKQQGQTQTVTGNSTLANFTGRYGEYRFNDFKKTVDLNVEKTGEVVQLSQVKIGLSPTHRAKNEIEIKGRVDLSQTNAMKGNLTINSESLDITPIYDLFTAKKESATNGSAKSPTETGSTPSSNEEPAPMQLPVKDFTLDVNIGKFFLREVAITNLQVATKVADNRISLNPLQLTLNGAPVKAKADVDLGVKGYAYDLTLTADKIPLEPLANSFMADKKGQIRGDMLANVQVKGTGITGASLKKSGNGQISLIYTNAQIQLAPTGKIGGTLKLISAILKVDLLQSPLNWVDAQIALGGGNITLQKTEIASETFQANAQGAIPIADDLMKSQLNGLPVDLALRRSIAEKAGLVPANTPTNAAFVALPNLFKLKGPIDAPEVDYNKLGLVNLIGQSKIGSEIERATGLPKGALQAPGEILKGSNVLQNIGILTGRKTGAQTNAAPGTNATNKAVKPSTNAPPSTIQDLNNVIDLFKKKK